MKRNAITIGLALLMFGGLCIFENNMVAERPSQPGDTGTSSVYMLAGEFRTVFANLLWIKADNYHHEYLQTHKYWTKNTDLIGFMEMIRKLDPHFVEAYSVGTALYSKGAKDNTKALKFLLEGIQCNPKAWELHRDAAVLYTMQFKNPKFGLRHAELALSYCDDKYYIPSLQRMVRTIRKLTQEASINTQKAKGQ